MWSPGGIDHDGFTLKLMLGGGNYRYISGALGDAEVNGRLLARQHPPRLALCAR